MHICISMRLSVVFFLQYKCFDLVREIPIVGWFFFSVITRTLILEMWWWEAPPPRWSASSTTVHVACTIAWSSTRQWTVPTQRKSPRMTNLVNSIYLYLLYYNVYPFNMNTEISLVGCSFSTSIEFSLVGCFFSTSIEFSLVGCSYSTSIEFSLVWCPL